MATRRPSWLSVAALALGCATTTVAYPGPRRPAREVAALVNADTALEMLDGQQLTHLRSQDDARYEVLPGRHTLGVSLSIVAGAAPGSYAEIERSANVAVFCLDVEAGRTYVIGHAGRGASWRPLITDDDTRAVVPFAPCPKP